MKIKRNLETEESRKVWENVDRAAARVAAWPSWMRGEMEDDSDPALRNSTGESTSQSLITYLGGVLSWLLTEKHN